MKGIEAIEDISKLIREIVGEYGAGVFPLIKAILLSKRRWYELKSHHACIRPKLSQDFQLKFPS